MAGNNLIKGSSIDADTVTAANIAADTITASEIAADTITASEIAASTITNTEIADTTITGGKLANDTVTATQIAGNTITASEIAPDTITSSELATGSVGSDELATNAVDADAMSAAAKTSVLESKVKGVKVQHAQLANPAASTLDVTTTLNFNTTAGVDPEGTAKGVTCLLEAPGGTEFNTTTGRVGTAALARSSLYPITDDTGNPITDTGNGNARVWGVVSTPARDNTGPYLLRFFSGEFGSGSEQAYTMTQAFVPFCPQLFDLSDFPAFDSGDVIFFDGSSSGVIAPGSITDTELNDSVQGKSANVERDREIFNHSKGWMKGGQLTSVGFVANDLFATIADIDHYADDGTYTRITGSVPLLCSNPGSGSARISYLVITSAGALALREGSAAAATPFTEPADDATPVAGDLLLYRIVNWGLEQDFTIEDRRPDSPRWFAKIREEVTATTTCVPTFRPSRGRDGVSTGPGFPGKEVEAIMNVYVDGKRSQRVAIGAETNGDQYYLDYTEQNPANPTGIPTVTFGADNTGKTVVLEYETADT